MAPPIQTSAAPSASLPAVEERRENGGWWWEAEMGRRRKEWGGLTLVSLATTMRPIARQIQFGTAPCDSSEVF